MKMELSFILNQQQENLNNSYNNFNIHQATQHGNNYKYIYPRNFGVVKEQHHHQHHHQNQDSDDETTTTTTTTSTTSTPNNFNFNQKQQLLIDLTNQLLIDNNINNIKNINNNIKNNNNNEIENLEFSPLSSLTEASAMAYTPSSPLSMSPRLSLSSPVSPTYSITSPSSPASCCSSPRGGSGSEAVVPKKELNGLKKPRKSYEVSKKLEILEEKQKHGMPFVVEKYHISRSIISRWLSNIEKYRSFQKKNLKKLHKGPKSSFSAEQEQSIIDRINEHKANGELVNGEVIKSIALQLSKQLNNNNFKASSGWLENFKNRHGLKA